MNHSKKTYNEATIIGCLGRDPVTKYTPSGKPVLSIMLATTSSFKRDDTKGERTTWVPVTLWGLSAEYIGKYAHKGSRLLVTGPVESRTWEDAKTGEKKYGTEVVCEHVQILADPQPKVEEGATQAIEEDLPW